MLKHVATVLFALIALPVEAQEPMSADRFETYTRDKTLTFSSNGVAYGVEQYLRDRRVRWSFLDGECREGRWYPRDDAICFVYEGGLGPQCWRFFEAGDGLRAEFEDDGGTLYETQSRDAPLECPGPQVGV